MAINYDAESSENKALLDNYANNLRATLGQLAKLLATFENLQDQYNEEISPILDFWVGDPSWPNKSNLAGSSVSETQTQMVTWQSYLDTALTQVGTAAHRAQMVSAAGPDNA